MAQSQSRNPSYAEGLNQILLQISQTMAAPDADMRFLMGLQMATLQAIKAGPAAGQRGMGGPMGQGGGPPGGGMGATPGGSPGGGVPPGMSPSPAGQGSPNQQQVAPQQGGMGVRPLAGMGAMQQNPDELRRMIQQQVGA